MPLSILRGSAEAPIEPLHGRRVAVAGFGNQGEAHALNLRDSGIAVIVGSRPGLGLNRARSHALTVQPISEAVRDADLIIIALPDETQPQVLEQAILPNMKRGATVGFLHGFCVRYGLLHPLPAECGVVMVAPKGPGATLRQRYLDGHGIPCLMAVHQESVGRDAEHLALAWANAIGCARAAIIRTTFAHETETDLFGEQAVLCGGMTGLIVAAFETLVDAGYPAELAYLECCHELKQVADLVHARGPAGMMKSISNTAEFGAHRAANLIVDESLRGRFRSLLRDIQSGAFAEFFREDYGRDFSWFQQKRQALADHPIEAAGDAVRALMPWLDAGP